MKLPSLQPTKCASNQLCAMVSRWIPPRSYTLFSSWRTEELALKKYGDKSYAHLDLDGHLAAIGECGSTATGRFAAKLGPGPDVRSGDAGSDNPEPAARASAGRTAAHHHGSGGRPLHHARKGPHQDAAVAHSRDRDLLAESDSRSRARPGAAE